MAALALREMRALRRGAASTTCERALDRTNTQQQQQQQQ
jgi:hypothetical protein